MTADMKSLLCIEHLEISFHDVGKWNPIVHDVSFQIYPGEIAVIAGPSGCGKSLTAQAMVGLLGSGFKVTDGDIKYNGKTITGLDEKRLQQLRREEMALLIQDSLSGLDPICTVRKQMTATVKQQKKWARKDLESYLHSLLCQVGFTEPEEILASYPFELSGGMRQRVLLAMMLSLRPKIFIADEPTTALDAINREKVLSLFKKLQQDFGLTILLITHDQQSVHRIADRVIQMRQGGIVP